MPVNEGRRLVADGETFELEGIVYEVVGAMRLFGHDHYKVKSADMMPGSWFGIPFGIVNRAVERRYRVVYEAVNRRNRFPTAAEEFAPPRPSAGPDIADLVAADIAARKAAGVAKYGMPLRAGNGRDALMDAYQEALDLCCYLRQAIEERTTAGNDLARDDD